VVPVPGTNRAQLLPRDETLQELTPLRIDLFVDPLAFREQFPRGSSKCSLQEPSAISIFHETVPGCGGNYLQLPNAGHLRNAFERDFDFLFYQEGKVGPRNADAVVVELKCSKSD